VGTAEAGLAAAKAARADVVIGLGGGSAVDTGKAIAALLTQPEGLMAYMEVVGQGKPLVNPSAPFIAVPTTAGTGSEARAAGAPCVFGACVCMCPLWFCAVHRNTTSLTPWLTHARCARR
jgi:hypothetical protein